MSQQLPNALENDHSHSDTSKSPTPPKPTEVKGTNAMTHSSQPQRIEDASGEHLITQSMKSMTNRESSPYNTIQVHSSNPAKATPQEVGQNMGCSEAFNKQFQTFLSQQKVLGMLPHDGQVSQMHITVLIERILSHCHTLQKEERACDQSSLRVHQKQDKQSSPPRRVPSG